MLEGSMINREAAMLILREGPAAQKSWVLDRPEMVIGRQADCDIVLDDRQVSRRHSRIVRDADGYVLSDLNSKNGTFVNGEALVGERRLRDGDEIQIALVFRLAFVDAGATVPLFIEMPARPRGLRLDKEARMVYVDDKALEPPLSPAQFRLLELLYDNPERVIEREEVVRAVWPDEDEAGVTEQAIDALVRRLRERLAELDPQTQYIATVRGHGFRLSRR
jgi:pSer/pThr/pTyr-binding forkhead associated (FHA) protein